MNPVTRETLNKKITGHFLEYAIKDSKLSTRLKSVARSAGFGDAIALRREDKRSIRAKARAAKQSRRANRG